MKVGLQISRFDWPGGSASIGPTLARIVRTADDAGFNSLWVMDHFFQIRAIGPSTEPMLEGMTALGFMAAHSSRARLGLLVGGVHYRLPGLWAKATTTLDVLSGGRAWLGIGAAWNQEESDALGFPFPPLGQRFEMLEETLRIVREMWQGERGSEATFEGRHVRAGRLLNVPQAISRPHPPIMIGGGGEQKTLRLVARYADATNVFGGPEQLAHKYSVLRHHCKEIGRPYDEIERSTLQTVELADPSVPSAPLGGGRMSRGPETPDQVVDRFGYLADAGVQHVITGGFSKYDPATLERFGRDVIPQLRSL